MLKFFFFYRLYHLYNNKTGIVILYFIVFFHLLLAIFEEPAPPNLLLSYWVSHVFVPSDTILSKTRRAYSNFWLNLDAWFLSNNLSKILIFSSNMKNFPLSFQATIPIEVSFLLCYVFRLIHIRLFTPVTRFWSDTKNVILVVIISVSIDSFFKNKCITIDFLLGLPFFLFILLSL